VTIPVSGCSFYEEGCGCTNPQLPESSFQAAMSTSQCHSACMADFIWLLSSKQNDFVTKVLKFLLFELLGGSRNR
jgi:hypothetical protein